MSGSSPNLVVEAELTRLRRIAEWQMASMGMAVGPAPRPVGTNLLGASYDDAGALLPQGGVPGVYSGGLSAAANLGPTWVKAKAFVDAFCGVEAVPVVQPVPDIQQAVTQAMGSLAVLLERSRCVLGQSLIGIGAFVDPAPDPVVVAASKPVNPALARAMGCGSRQPIGFVVR